MDFVRKTWKAAKIHKKVKLAKCYKKLKPTKLVDKFTKEIRMLFPAAAASIQEGRREDNLAFMTFIIKVNPNKAGWQKSIISLLKNCKGIHFKMDQDGVMEVSGISDPNKLLKKIGKSSKVELHWFQFGQCSSNLFMPESKKKEKPNNDNNSLPPYRDYRYHYQLPQVFNKPYAPY